MYQLEKIKKKIADKEAVIGANVVLSDAVVSELMGFAGCDYVWIDMEHASFTYKDTERHIMAAHSGGAAAFVRIPWNDPVMAKRVLDMGPDGIIFPLIKNAQEAKAAVESCMYPPKGIRGWNPLRANKYGCVDNDWYIENVDHLIWKIMMIEQIEAVENLEEILKVDGVDAILIGPSDLSGSMGKLLQTNSQEFQAVIDKIIKTAQKTETPVAIAIPTGTPASIVREWFHRGIQIISIGQDEYILSSFLKNSISDIHEALTNDNKSL